MIKLNNNFYFLYFKQTKRLFDVFKLNGVNAKFVGGCVRDSLIGKITDDFDIAVDCDIVALSKILNEAGFKVILTGLRYGSITSIVDGMKFELTSLRKDLDCDGRDCKTSRTSSFKEDAKRRDFTINALYVSKFGHLFDYFNGINDLKEGRVIFIGNPEERIKEDYLRIFRYYRFSAKFKDFSDKYSNIVKQNVNNIKKLSIERVQKELLLILHEESNLEIFKMIKNNGVFKELDINSYEKLLCYNPSFELKAYILFGYETLIRKFRLPMEFQKKIKLIKNFENESILYSLYKNNEKFANDMHILRKIKFNILEEFPKIEVMPQFVLKYQDLPTGIDFASRRLKACERWWVNRNFIDSKQDCLNFIAINSKF